MMHKFSSNDHRGQDRRKYPLSRAMEFFRTQKSTMEGKKIENDTNPLTCFAFGNLTEIRIGMIGIDLGTANIIKYLTCILYTWTFNNMYLIFYKWPSNIHQPLMHLSFFHSIHNLSISSILFLIRTYMYISILYKLYTYIAHNYGYKIIMFFYNSLWVGIL